MNQRIDPASEIARLSAALKANAKRVADGADIDTRDLARDIEILCEQLAANPANSTQPFADDLQILLNGLDGLESALRDKHDDLTRRLAILAPEPAGDR